MIAATPAVAPTIVAEAIKQDQELRQKVPAPAGRSDAELAAEVAFYDVRGNSRFDRLGAGSAAALFRRSDYGSMSSQWDPKTGVLGLTPANFGSTEFSRAGLDLATTQHLFRQGFSAPAILQATSLTRDLGIGIKENVAAVARLKRDVKGIEPSLRTVKSLTDQINTEDKAAREAHGRGDREAGAEHQRRADEARQKRQKLVDEERDRIKRERPDKPGLVQDFDATVKAITRREVQIDADLKAGRITQQQADEKQAVLRDRRSNSLADQVRVQVHAERAGRRDPQASSPARARAAEEIKTAEVQRRGREAGEASVSRRSGWEDSDNQDENRGVAAHA